MPFIVVVEGSTEQSHLCAELMVKLHRSLAFEGVTWIPRTEDEPVGVESEMGKVLMRDVLRYEFDHALKKRIDQAHPNHLFILSGLYDAGTRWRRVQEIQPNVVWYVENSDSRRAAFAEFMQDAAAAPRTVRADDVTAIPTIISVALELVSGPPKQETARV